MFKLISIFTLIASIVFVGTGCLSTKPYLKKPFALVIKFNSVCCGVPDEQPLRDVIHQIVSDEDESGFIGWKLSPMGKEGEYWICIQGDRKFRSLQSKLTDAVSELAKQPQERGGISLDSNFVLQSSSIPQQAKWESIWFE